jgi:hypothetical protein
MDCWTSGYSRAVAPKSDCSTVQPIDGQAVPVYDNFSVTLDGRPPLSIIAKWIRTPGR